MTSWVASGKIFPVLGLVELDAKKWVGLGWVSESDPRPSLILSSSRKLANATNHLQPERAGGIGELEIRRRQEG